MVGGIGIRVVWIAKIFREPWLFLPEAPLLTHFSGIVAVWGSGWLEFNVPFQHLG